MASSCIIYFDIAAVVIMAVTNSTEYPQMKKEPDQPVVAGETPIVIF